MTDDNSVQTEEVPPKRGRPPKVKQRRNYVKELAALQAKVDMAVRLLKRVEGAPTVVTIAIETLTEE